MNRVLIFRKIISKNGKWPFDDMEEQKLSRKSTLCRPEDLTIEPPFKKFRHNIENCVALKLPIELWHKILFFLQPGDALSLSSVCRSLYQTFNEEFWSHWVVRIQNPIFIPVVVPNWKLHCLSLFPGSVKLISEIFVLILFKVKVDALIHSLKLCDSIQFSYLRASKKFLVLSLLY
jgi:hypothetical protein